MIYADGGVCETLRRGRVVTLIDAPSIRWSPVPA